MIDCFISFGHCNARYQRAENSVMFRCMVSLLADCVQKAGAVKPNVKYMMYAMQIKVVLMKITELIWLDDVIEKIKYKHHCLPTEVEEVFADKPDVRKMHKGHFRNEDVYRVLGQTEAGRYLTVFFIRKRTNEALILSARDMDEKRFFHKKSSKNCPSGEDRLYTFYTMKKMVSECGHHHCF